MKISIKIFLLLLFIVAAVGGVLIFIKTQVAPPGNVTFHDQYSAPLAATVSTVGDKPFPDNSDNFRQAYHKIMFMYGEGIIADPQADSLIMKIDTVYGNSLVDYAYRLFNSPEWPEERLQLISNTIEDLRMDHLSHGEPAISASLENNFYNVDVVIANYRAAWEFTGDTVFRNLSDATQRINTIENYRLRPYLSNNNDLMAALDAMPRAINRSHYNYLESEINKLGTYRNYSENDYNRIVQPQVERATNEYISTTIYGNNKIPMDPLRAKAERLILEASEYYDRIEMERMERERRQQEYYWDEDLYDLYEQSQRSSSESGFIL